jgi:cation-transporting ATPase 13A1
MSDDLYPGDIVMIEKPAKAKGMTMPCDLLMISGSAVVNESILTGESQPLIKEGIGSKEDQDEVLNLK